MAVSHTVLCKHVQVMWILFEWQILQVKVAFLNLALLLLRFSFVNHLVHLAFLNSAVRHIARYSINKLSVRLHWLNLFHIEQSDFMHLFEQLLELFLWDWTASCLYFGDHSPYVVEHVVDFANELAALWTLEEFFEVAIFVVDWVLAITAIRFLSLSLPTPDHAHLLHASKFRPKLRHQLLRILHSQIPTEPLHIISFDSCLLGLKVLLVSNDLV